MDPIWLKTVKEDRVESNLFKEKKELQMKGELHPDWKIIEEVLYYKGTINKGNQQQLVQWLGASRSLAAWIDVNQ